MLLDILTFGHNLFNNRRTQDDWIEIKEESYAPIAGEEPVVFAEKKHSLINPYRAFVASHYGILPCRTSVS